MTRLPCHIVGLAGCLAGQGQGRGPGAGQDQAGRRGRASKLGFAAACPGACVGGRAVGQSCSCGRCCTCIDTPGRYLSVSICIHAGQASADLKHPDLVLPAPIVIIVAAVTLEQKQPPRYRSLLIIVNHAGLVPVLTAGTGTGSLAVGGPSISSETANSAACA